MKLRTVQATRYVTPLREGGSLPAIVEAGDLGLYVLKFRGAGQGPLALVAELIAGEIGRLIGLPVPEIVFVEVDEAFGRNEPDEEVRDLLRASVGLNLAMDYLPGSVMFDVAAGDRVSVEVASLAVWFDAFVTNVDRTARNPNLLYWLKSPYFIDHGAALYFHHNWTNVDQAPLAKFAPIRDHVLLRWAVNVRQADAQVRALIGEGALREIIEQVPVEWLTAGSHSAYADYFKRRLEASSNFVEEAVRARAELV